MTKLDMAGGIYISLGNGSDIGISPGENLVILDWNQEFISMGRATPANFDRLIKYLERLKDYAVDP